MTSGNAPAVRGILIATSHTGNADLDRLLGDRLLPLVDRPWVLRAAETFVALGCRQLDVVLGEKALAVRELLGDGERFGASIRYRTVRDSAGPLEPAWILPGGNDERVWFGTDRQLPAYSDLQDLARAPRAPNGIVLLTRDEHGQVEWSGWGCFTLQYLKSAAARRATWQTMNGWALRAPFLQRRFSDAGWRATSPQALLASQGRFLNERDTPLGIGFTARKPGTFISPRARVHPDATIVPPVYIGADSVIAADAVVGPNAVILEECSVAEGSTVTDSLVMHGTYVGPDLSLQDAIVDSDVYIHAKLDTAVRLVDPDLVGATHSSGARVARVPLWHRLIACLLAAATLPWMLVRLLRAQWPEAPSKYKEAIFDDRPGAWRAHCFSVVLPNLGAVAAGRLGLTGLELRSPEETACLDARWRDLHASHRMGLVSESLLLGEDGRNPLARRMADEYAAAKACAQDDLRLLARYATQVLFGAGPAWMSRLPTVSRAMKTETGRDGV